MQRDPAGEPTAGLLAVLADGRARPAGELARLAQVAIEAMRAVLRAQVAAGTVRALREGAHTYYALAGRDIVRTSPLPSIRPPGSTPDLCLARTCYRHLAGAFGVALYAVLRDRAWLRGEPRSWRLTPAGGAELAAQGLPVEPSLTGRDCRDWTLRQPHLGGPLGVAITAAMLDAGWFRRAAHSRVVTPCATGVDGFARWGADVAALRAAAAATVPWPAASD